MRLLAEIDAMPSSERCARERALRAAVLAGDDVAWRALYDEAFEPLFAYVAWRCGGRRDWAEEATQEAWLVAVRRIADFDPGRGDFLGWLRGIARNYLRQQQRRARPTAPLDGGLPTSADNAQQEKAEAIAHALSQLPERYEAVLRAKYLEMRTVEQIAREWGQNAKAIESLLTRARQAFRAAYSFPEESIFREPGHA